MEDIDDDDDYVGVEERENYKSSRNRTTFVTSPEIVEEIVEEQNNDAASSRDQNDDVYVAVGQNDIEIVKWAVDHLLSPGARLYLVHVYHTVTYIPTPVGKLARSQLTKDQVRFFVNEEENRRRNLLQKYIRLCNNAKVNVDTVLVEHDSTAKAIVDLIPFHNITNLVIGMKKLPSSRLLRTKTAKFEYVKKGAPDFCKVSVVHKGKKYVGAVEKSTGIVDSSQANGLGISSETTRQSFGRSSFLTSGCFSGKSKRGST